jgi:hypothetical protein
MNRRSCIALVGSLLAAVGADAAVLRRGVRRRMVRRRVRRRFRRRVITRVVLGRRFWVVPLAVAVGWELVHDNRVVVVKEIKTVVRDGSKVEVALVSDDTGKTEEVDILREDNRANAKDLGGSVIAETDKSTPGIDAEIEAEVSDDSK